MNKVREPNPRLADLVPYDPKYIPAQVMVSANENPRNIPDEVLDAALARLRRLNFNRYPDPLANELRDELAAAEGVRRENLLLGNGGDELLFDFMLAWGGPGRKMLNVPPTFSVYKNNCQLTGTEMVDVPRRPDYRLDEPAILERVSRGDIDCVIITSPNNPTGDSIRREFAEQLLDATDALVMIDQAYCEFSGKYLTPLIERHKNLLVLRTFSKAYSLAGVRLGYIMACPDVITEFIKVRQPYSVDAVSQAIALEVVRHRDLFKPRIRDIVEQRARLTEALSAMDGLTVFPSDANYVLVHFETADAGRIWERLLERGFLVRDFSRSAGLENCLRITVGTAYENEGLLRALSDLLKG